MLFSDVLKTATEDEARAVHAALCAYIENEEDIEGDENCPPSPLLAHARALRNRLDAALVALAGPVEPLPVDVPAVGKRRLARSRGGKWVPVTLIEQTHDGLFWCRDDGTCEVMRRPRRADELKSIPAF
jgi:hypothetical protein